MDSLGAVESRRVALFTPLPPAESGTADYAAGLIPELEKLVDLHVFERVPRGFNPESFDAVVYQIGNNPFHAAIYELALKHPGVAVLHETNLHDLIRGLTNGNEREYHREVIYEIFGRELEEFPSRDLIEPGPQPRAFTMMRRLLSRSKACIVHSRFAADDVRLAGFQGKISRIPHGTAIRKLDRGAYRNRLGIGPTQPLIGMFGYQRPDKMACDCLLAFRMLLPHLPDARLLLAGKPHPEVPAEDRIQALGLNGKAHVLGFQTLSDLDGYIAACDVILNLRSPTFGETSGTMMRSFGLGKTVVVSNIGSSQELPVEICAKIPVDEFQDRVLAECLQWLLSNREITEAIGAAAQRWATDTCSWEQVARMYAEALFPPVPHSSSPALCREDCDPGFLREYVRRWGDTESEGYRGLDQNLRRLVRTLELTPRGADGGRVLEMGCHLQITPALRNLLGYSEVRGCYYGPGGADVRMAHARDGEAFECVIDLFDAERDPFPYLTDYFNTVLCCEVLEYLNHDPIRMMSEIHRILKPGGTLLLTTPNAVSSRAILSLLDGNHPACKNRYPHPSQPSAEARRSRRIREYTPAEIANLLSDSGFIVSKIETGSYGEDSFPESDSGRDIFARRGRPVHLRGDCIFALGKKAELPKNRYPSWLYEPE